MSVFGVCALECAVAVVGADPGAAVLAIDVYRNDVGLSCVALLTLEI